MPRCPGRSQEKIGGPRMVAAGVLIAALFTSAALSGCGVSISIVEPTTKARQSSATGTGDASSPAGPTPAASTPGGAEQSAGPSPQTTAGQWKTYVDPKKSVSFELPPDWTAKLVPGRAPNAVVVQVREPSGTVVATLETQMQGLGGACGTEAMRPYTVLASTPMAVPSTNTGPSAVDPRYVYRVIQGANHFYASYGITDNAAGADGTACLV